MRGEKVLGEKERGSRLFIPVGAKTSCSPIFLIHCWLTQILEGKIK